MAKLGESITTEYGALSYDKWDRATEYKQYQRVQHDGLVYAAKSNSTGIAPGTDDDVWELLGSLPVEQGNGRDTVVFSTGDKVQNISGKSVNGGKGVSVGKNQVSNTINANTDDETVKVNDNNKLYVPKATAGNLGVVRAGTGISIDDEGTISANIPVADEHKIGSKDGIAPFFITEDEETKKTIITGNSIVGGDNTTVAQKGEYTYGVDVATATTEKPGVVQVGSGLSVNGGILSADEYSLPVASASTLGGVKVGKNLSIDSDGALSASDPYTLPTASADTLGGVKVGDGLSIADGVLSTSGGSGSGWETVERTGTTTSEYFSSNCYKNNNFILFNFYAKQDGTVSTYLEFTCTNLKNPFLNDGISHHLIPICGFPITNNFTDNQNFYFTVTNKTTGLYCYFMTSNISHTKNKLYSFIIPYIEI